MSISLLDRLSSAGPVRNNNKSSPRTSEPYNRNDRERATHTKGNVEGTWSHDLFEQNTLAARMGNGSNNKPNAGPKSTVRLNNMAQQAISQATGGGGSSLSIKGAGAARPNVVEVSQLAAGTTAQDVEAIFKQCGAITSCKIHISNNVGVAIRVTFKDPASAQAAVKKFHGQPADGRTLVVVTVGATATGLAQRLGGATESVRNTGSVDVLMDGGNAGGSKMRSDELVADSRASILLAPPGQPISDYTVTPRGPRGGRGGGGGNKRGGRGGRGQKR